MATVSAFPTGNATQTGTWTNGATGLNADDGTKGTFATVTKNATGNLLAGTFGFNTSLPVDAIVNTVSLEVQNDTLTTAQGTQRHAVEVGGVAGANNDNTGSLTETVRTFSSLARPGGGVWTRADLLDGTFTVRVTAIQPNNTTSTTYEWDYVKVTVDYTVPPPILVMGRVSR